MSVRHTTMESPVGELTLVADDGGLTGLYFAEHKRRPAADRLGERTGDGFAAAIGQLRQYFDGERTTFDLPLAPRGSAFDQRVWRLLREIPHGTTRTYGDLARDLGDSGLARAVGAANGRNPLSVLVPCHRLVGAGGALTGYAGGVDRKRYLLDLERRAAR